MYRSLQNQNYFVIPLVSLFHILLLLGAFLLDMRGRMEVDVGFMTKPMLIDLQQGASLNIQSSHSAAQNLKNLPEVSKDQKSMDMEGVFAHPPSSPIGADIDQSHPTKIDGPKPHYPLVSRRLKQEGLVIVRLCIDGIGVVRKADIQQSSGFRALDESALNALSKWRFSTPSQTLHAGIDGCFRLPVRFTLEG